MKTKNYVNIYTTSKYTHLTEVTDGATFAGFKTTAFCETPAGWPFPELAGGSATSALAPTNASMII